MKIKIKLETEFVNTAPRCKIYTTRDSRTFTLGKQANIEVDLPCFAEDKLSINFLNKDGVEDNVVRIKELHIDDINLQHFIYNGVFYPEYDQQWYNEQETKPPKFYSPCTELRHNGTWHLNITLPIWKMMMENWLDDKANT